MAEVQRIRTPLSETELAVALRDAHVLACGGPPSLSRWASMWAQLALEHARGKALDNYCAGNVTAAKSWTGDYYVLACDERVQKNPDVWKRLELHFRAFGVAVAGARSYVELLCGRYARALEQMDRGNPSGAAYVLGQMGYYTAHEQQYANAMSSLEHYAASLLLPGIPVEGQTAYLCDSADCDGELRSMLSKEDIEQAIAQNLLSLQNQTAEDPLFAEHGDPSQKGE